jgi:hypothetical protein
MSVDQIYVVSLHSCQPRREKLKKFIPESGVTWWLVKRDKNPKKGCFTSHRDIFKDAKQKDYKNIIILEDDARPRVSWENVENRIKKFLRNPPKNWKFLMLGYYPVRLLPTKLKGILAVKCAYTTHAYLVNVSNVKLPVWNGKVQIDDELFCNGLHENGRYLESKFNGTYAVEPILVDQKSETSTINNTHLDIQKTLEAFGNDKLVGISKYVNTNLVRDFAILISIFVFFSMLFGLLSIKFPVLWIPFVISISVFFCILFGYTIIFIYDGCFEGVEEERLL